MLALFIMLLIASPVFAYERGPVAQSCLDNPPGPSEPSMVSLCRAFDKVEGEERAQAERSRIFKQEFNNGSSASVCGLDCRIARLDTELAMSESSPRPMVTPFSCYSTRIGFSTFTDCY